MGLTEERLIDGNPVRDPKLTSKTWSWFENDRAFRRDRFQTNWRFWKSIEGRVQVSINNSRLCQTHLEFSVLPPDARVTVSVNIKTVSVNIVTDPAGFSPNRHNPDPAGFSLNRHNPDPAGFSLNRHNPAQRDIWEWCYSQKLLLWFWVLWWQRAVITQNFKNET